MARKDQPGLVTYRHAYYEQHTKPARRAVALAQQQPTGPVHPLTEAREALGFTVRGLASTMGMSPTSIVKWEHGGIPTVVYAEKLAEHLGFASGSEVRALCEQWQAEHKEEASDE